MARRSPVLPLALALALGGVGAWLLGSEPDAPAAPGLRADDRAAGQGSNPDELDPLSSEGSPARGELATTAPSAMIPQPGGAEFELSALVNVRFIRADTADPVVGFLFGLRRSDLPRVELGIPEGPRVGPWTTESFGIVDGEGLCTFRVAAGAQFSGNMRGRPGHPSPFVELTPSAVHFGALAAGDSEEILVRLHPKRRTTAHFRFVDAVSGALVPDARIHPMANRWIEPGLHGPERGLWTPLTELVARANPSGHLRLEEADLDGPAEVFAEGYGPAWIRFRRGGSEAEPQTVPMHPPGRIDGILGGLPVGSGAVEVQLRATHTDLGFNQVRGREDMSTWHVRLPVGSGGKFTLDDVPSSGMVTLDVCVGGDVIHSARIKVPPAGLRAFSWAWTERVALGGVLLDGEGQPLGDAQVWAHPTKAGLAYTTFRSVRKPLHWVNTAEDGTFRLEGLEPGRYAVGPARGPGPGYARVVSAPYPGSLTVRPPETSTVQGQVLLDGAGVPQVSLRSTEGYFTKTLDDGRFELECLGVSGVSIWVHGAWQRGQDRFVGGFTVRAAPGETGVILELVPEVRRGAVAVDSSTGEPVPAEFTLVLLNPGDKITVRRQLGEQEALRSLRVPDGPAIVWAHTSDDRVGRTQRLGPLGSRGQMDTQITVAPGGRVRMSAASRRRVDVSDAGGPIHGVWVGPDGAELVLPTGSYRLTAEGVMREVKVQAGSMTEAPRF